MAMFKGLSYPSPVNRDYSMGCMIQDVGRPKRREDCFFYTEEQDMGAHIPHCTYYGGYEDCVCEECRKYINNKTAHGVIRNWVDKGGQMYIQEQIHLLRSLAADPGDNKEELSEALNEAADTIERMAECHERVYRVVGELREGMKS